MKVFAFIGNFVASVLASIFGGYATAKLWAWFVVPTLHAPPLSIPQAVGLTITANVFFIGINMGLAKLQLNTKPKEEKGYEEELKSSVILLVTQCVTTGMLLLSGYIWHLFL